MILTLRDKSLYITIVHLYNIRFIIRQNVKQHKCYSIALTHSVQTNQFQKIPLHEGSNMLYCPACVVLLFIGNKSGDNCHKFVKQ